MILGLILIALGVGLGWVVLTGRVGALWPAGGSGES